jgi:hypothetical protein
MEQEFDDALRALAAVQLKYGVRNILLSVQEPIGDVLATIREDGRTFAAYARIDGQTRAMVRLRDAALP